MTEPLLVLTLPWPPTVNTYWDHVRMVGKRGDKAGKVYIGKKVSSNGEAFRHAVLEAVHKGHRAAPMLEGRLAVWALASPPDNRERDLDNLWKSTLDALQWAGVMENDAQVDDIRIVRGPVCAPGAFHLAVMKFDPDGAEEAMRGLLQEGGNYAS